MKKGEGLYYKIARPNGFDFFTGKTINYREAIKENGGKGWVEAPGSVASPQLCAPGVLHASRRAEDCFQGGSIPCSLYRVRGIPVVEDSTKAGFRQLSVLEELDPATHFQWRYAEACNPVHPFKLVPPEISPEHLRLLNVWASVWDSVRASVGAYTGSLFTPVVKEWQYVQQKRGQYPFQSAVDLWRRGLVPSYDGRTWRLHAGPEATVVYEEGVHDGR